MKSCQGVAALAAALPARLEKIGVLHGHALVLRLAGARPIYLYCAPDPPVRGICVAPHAPPAAWPPAEWLGEARAQLEQTNVVACQPAPGEDVLELVFSSGWRLVIHFFGRRGNAVLVDEHGLVRAVWRAVPCHAVGSVYVRRAPPAQGTADAHGMRDMPLDQLVAGVRELELTEARRAAQRRLAAQRVRLLERLRKIERDMEETARAAEYRAQGELLKAFYHLLKPGMRAVTVPDYRVTPPADVTIPLDPDKTPQQNMAWYFKKALKLERGRDVIAARHALTLRELAANDDACRLLTTCTDVRALHAVGRPVAPAKRASSARAAPAAASNIPTARIGRFISSDGLLILVGRSAADNDTLTMRLARGNDLWLHTRDRAGAHVVVRTNRAQDVPRRTLLEAAQLCAHFSHTPDGALEDVLYVARKHVSKPKGAKPGLVHVAGGKTITVRHNARAIKEWIATHPAEGAP